MKTISFTALILLSVLQSAFAANYWAKTTGDDGTGDGSEGNPFLTIQAAVDATASGADDVCVGNGTYTAGFVMAEGTTSGYVGHFSGTAENPVTVSNCEGGTVIIDLGEAISGWEDLGGNIWESDAITNTSASILFRGTTTLSNLKQSDCANVNAEGRWCISTNVVQLYTTDDPTGETLKFATGTAVQIRDIDYITVDGIDIHYSSNPMTVGTSFSAPLGPARHITIKNSEYLYTGTRGIRLISSATHHTENIIIDSNTIKWSADTSGDNGHCIKLDSNTDGYRTGPVEIKNNTLEGCWYHGVQASNTWQDVSIHDNVIVDPSVKGSGQGAGIRCGDVDGCEIYDNHIYANNTSLGTGIYIQDGPFDTLVYGNRIHGFDWHGIYVFGTGGNNPGVSGAHIRNNIIYDNDVSGIRIEESQSIYIDNNTIVESGSSASGGGIDLNHASADGVVMRNNIISSTSKLAIRTVSGSTFTDDSNILWRGDGGNLITLLGATKTFAQFQDGGYGVRSLNQDPVLDSAENLYVPEALSPARNAGRSLKSVFTVDYDGTARGNSWDMGAHEVSSELVFDGVTIN